MVSSRSIRNFSSGYRLRALFAFVYFYLYGFGFALSSDRQLVASENDPLGVEMLYVPMSTFVLTERRTCLYTTEKVKEYVKAMEVYSPNIFNEPSSLSANFYFVKLEHHAGDEFLLDYKKRGTQRVKSKALNTRKILGGTEHFEFYLGQAPIEQEHSTVFCPGEVLPSGLVRCTLTMLDTFGDKTIILMRSIQSSLKDSFNVRDSVSNENIPHSVEPNIEKFGEAFLSFMPPFTTKESYVKISFAGSYIPALNNSGRAGDKYELKIDKPDYVDSKKSVLDIDIRFIGLDVSFLENKIVQQNLVTSGITNGLGLSDKLHAVPKMYIFVQIRNVVHLQIQDQHTMQEPIKISVNDDDC